MKRVSHWIVHYMDPPEPKRESATEEAVDAHHHVHVEIPGARQTLKCWQYWRSLMKKCAHLTWLSPNPLQSRTITTPATWVLSSWTTSSKRVKTPVKKSKRGTWEIFGHLDNTDSGKHWEISGNNWDKMRKYWGICSTSEGGHWPSLSTTTLLPSSSRLSGLNIRSLFHTCSRADGGPALM